VRSIIANARKRFRITAWDNCGIPSRISRRIITTTTARRIALGLIPRRTRSPRKAWDTMPPIFIAKANSNNPTISRTKSPTPSWKRSTTRTIATIRWSIWRSSSHSWSWEGNERNDNGNQNFLKAFVRPASPTLSICSKTFHGTRLFPVVDNERRIDDTERRNIATHHKNNNETKLKFDILLTRKKISRTKNKECAETRFCKFNRNLINQTNEKKSTHLMQFCYVNGWTNIRRCEEQTRTFTTIIE